MTAQARLLSVRLQGFKSFAERTQVVFGPGISAIVGPNGSGKSNLADALRWSLGEQGRALRTRKAEDVIWAGSERRPAVGMADVQIVLDNGDGLLPIDFGVVELGRRLFRSGENEYVLNRERVRLRDLVDLLDAAHLAENAFLFIGQGMVDQALALRPEERRPLFEEVAGVRRHDRRRRRAEEQLAEASANLTRVEDVLAELRPQVRRLAAQAEQQASRRDAGVELVEALLLSGHARWHAAATRLSGASRAQEDLRGSIDTATAELRELEAAAAGGSEQLGLTAAAVDNARAELEAARERLSTARVEAASVAAELDAIGRDRARLTAEHDAASAALAVDRRALAITIPTVDPALEHEAREAQRAVDEASRELAQARTASLAAAAERDAAERAEARRSADLELARRRASELDREREDAELAAARSAEARDAAGTIDAEARGALAAASARSAEASTVEHAAAERVRTNETALDDGLRARAAASARLAASDARLAALREQVQVQVGGSLATAARSAGGTALLDGVRLDESLRAAVGAALGDSAAAYVVSRERAANLAGERGSVVIEEGLRLPSGGDRAATQAAAGREGDLGTALRATGGGRLADAIQHDPNGHVRALLSTAIWVPDLIAALALQPVLPAGWVAVTRDGTAVVHGPTVSLGHADGPIELAAAVDAMSDEVESRRSVHQAAEADVEHRRDALAATRTELELAQSARQAASEDHAAAAAAAQAAGRRVEAATREAAWLAAQADRARAAAERATVTLGELDRNANRMDPVTGEPPSGETAVGALERRVSALAAIRDRADAAWRTADAGRRDAERERSRAEAAIALGERRIDELEAAMTEIAGRVVAAERRKAASSSALLGAGEAAAAAQDALERALGEDATARTLFGGAERARLVASEALRAREERGRAIEREELEARLSLESVRESLLVELAGLGALGLRHLRAVAAAEGGDASASAEADRFGATANAADHSAENAAE
ncbi:MAG TPA: AAA family ATPase, partial [Candidatus Limnocylindrales bacterium]|nr:AAA family ATPase [Candidatus Limnocylindrales bacterium]